MSTQSVPANLAILQIRGHVVGVGLQHDEGTALLGRQDLQRLGFVARRNDTVAHLISCV